MSFLTPRRHFHQPNYRLSSKSHCQCHFHFWIQYKKPSSHHIHFTLHSHTGVTMFLSIQSMTATEMNAKMFRHNIAQSSRIQIKPTSNHPRLGLLTESQIIYVRSSTASETMRMQSGLCYTILNTKNWSQELFFGPDRGNSLTEFLGLPLQHYTWLFFF